MLKDIIHSFNILNFSYTNKFCKYDGLPIGNLDDERHMSNYIDKMKLYKDAVDIDT